MDDPEKHVVAGEEEEEDDSDEGGVNVRAGGHSGGVGGEVDGEEDEDEDSDDGDDAAPGIRGGEDGETSSSGDGGSGGSGSGSENGSGGDDDDDGDEFDMDFLEYQANDDNRGAERMADGVMKNVKPVLHQLSLRLVELQEAHLVLCHSISKERNKLVCLPELRHVVRTMSMLPLYRQKIAAIKKKMVATTALVAKVERQAADLHRKTVEGGEPPVVA